MRLRRMSKTKNGSVVFSWFAIAAISLLGSVVGVTLFGHGPADIGPLRTDMRITPTINGGSVVDLGPLGNINFRSHVGVFRLDIKVRSMAPKNASELAVSTDFQNFSDDAAEDLRNGFASVAIRAALGSLLCTIFLSIFILRQRKRVVLAAILALSLSIFAGGTSYLSYKPSAILEPNYRGLIAAVPSLVGDVKEIAENFDLYRAQLTKLLDNVTTLYEKGLSLEPQGTGSDSTVVLHISDLHLNPEGWDVVKVLIEQFEVDIVVDTGDISDHGTPLEDKFLDMIPKLGIPYIYVRGNHDSMHTQDVIASIPNAEVLDNGSTVTIENITFTGTGDPRFTPDKSRESMPDAVVLNSARVMAEKSVGRGIDVALIHDPNGSEPIDGIIPLILSGHTHNRESKKLARGSILHIGGSTGGGGLRAFTSTDPAPLEATILYLNKKSGRLVAWDEITMGGIGLSSVELSRRLPSVLEK